jgi:hypothetical protein
MTETIDVDVSAIRSALLEVIGDLSSQYDNLQSSSVIQHAARKVLNRQPDRQVERALLASFYDLFRTGYLSWGHDLANPAPPFCHVTELGRRALAQRSRDPANPEGYLSHLRSRAGISSLTHSYVVEALNTFNAACFKATAVMVGAAAESLVLQVRDRLVERLQAIGRPIPSGLTDWRLKRILVAIEATTVARKASMPSALFERFEANWPAFTHQIRTARNEAGHPASVEPVTAEEVHASLLWPLSQHNLRPGSQRQLGDGVS